MNVGPGQEANHPAYTLPSLSPSERPAWIVDALVIGLLTVITVVQQERGLGLAYIENNQLVRHNAVLNGTAPNPWCYRVLTEYLAEALIVLSRVLHIQHPVASAFSILRILQNASVFAAALRYYRLLGLSARESIGGIVLLSYSMSYALFNSDLSFNTYLDLLFYLLAACVVVSGRRPWVVLPASVLASLNRETSLLISLLPIATLIGTGGRDWRRWITRIHFCAACFICQVVVLAILRFVIHPPEPPWESTWGNRQGWPTLWINLSSPKTLLFLALTLSVLPVAALWNFRALPPWLKGLFWMMVPVWFLVHLLTVYANETRLFLVPIALVFVPAALHPRRGECP